MADLDTTDGAQDNPQDLTAQDARAEQGSPATAGTAGTVRSAGEAVGGAARGAGEAMRMGLAAVRDVRAASRQHADARAQMRSLKEELSEAQARLERREQIERDYDQLVVTQQQALETARLEHDAARQQAGRLDAQRRQLEGQLAELKATNEERLRPYRSIADAAKGRADDAAVALAETKRALKLADAQVTDAANRRDQQVSAASRTLDAAQDRLHRTQGELDKMALDMAVAPETLNRMREEVAAGQAQLEAARAETTQTINDAQLAVDNAQTHLWTQRQSLEVAERRADEAKREATARREEYDGLYRQAKAAEDELSTAIKDRSRAKRQAEDEARAAAERGVEAQALLDEVMEVHATPEATAALRRKVAVGNSELERRGQELSQLAQQEKGLRRSTRTQRLVFFAVVIAVVVVVALLVWLLLPRG